MTYTSLDDVPEPHRATLRRAMGKSSRGRGIRRPDAATARRPTDIVTQAGMSGRTKLLLAFVAVDAMVVAAVVWLLVR